MEHTYWQRQTETPLFPDLLWDKPEQRSRAGKLCVVGGNKNGFVAVATAYEDALKAGAGQCRVVLPDALKKAVPPTITDVVFVPTNQAGGMNRESSSQLKAAAEWADGVLLIGDSGRNSETAIVFETLIREYSGPLTITRDAIDLLHNVSEAMLSRPETSLVCSFAQLQKLFQAVYYPKILTFSMQLTNLVEILHKFTITYPVTITVLHNEQLIVAQGGNVVSTPWGNPLSIWRGSVATKAATYWLWNRSKPLESIATSFSEN